MNILLRAINNQTLEKVSQDLKGILQKGSFVMVIVNGLTIHQGDMQGYIIIMMRFSPNWLLLNSLQVMSKTLSICQELVLFGFMVIPCSSL